MPANTADKSILSTDTHMVLERQLRFDNNHQHDAHIGMIWSKHVERDVTSENRLGSRPLQQIGLPVNNTIIECAKC